jgi:hypothetical protein
LPKGKRALIDDITRSGGVTAIGAGEHVRRHARRGGTYVTVITGLTGIRDGTGPARLPDMVQGRSTQAADPARHPDSATSPTTSPDHCPSPAASDPEHTLDCEEPVNRHLVVLERSVAPGTGGMVTADLRAALAGQHSPAISTVVAGLGGRAVTTRSLRDMLARAASGSLQPRRQRGEHAPRPRHHRVPGRLGDPPCYQSLPQHPAVTDEPERKAA